MGLRITWLYCSSGDFLILSLIILFLSPYAAVSGLRWGQVQDIFFLSFREEQWEASDLPGGCGPAVRSPQWQVLLSHGLFSFQQYLPLPAGGDSPPKLGRPQKTEEGQRLQPSSQLGPQSSGCMSPRLWCPLVPPSLCVDRWGQPRAGFLPSSCRAKDLVSAVQVFVQIIFFFHLPGAHLHG